MLRGRGRINLQSQEEIDFIVLRSDFVLDVFLTYDLLVKRSCIIPWPQPLVWSVDIINKNYNFDNEYLTSRSVLSVVLL